MLLSVERLKAVAEAAACLGRICMLCPFGIGELVVYDGRVFDMSRNEVPAVLAIRGIWFPVGLSG